MFVASTYAHTSLSAILPGEPGLACFPFTLPLHTSCLTPSRHVLLMTSEKGRR